MKAINCSNNCKRKFVCFGELFYKFLFTALICFCFNCIAEAQAGKVQPEIAGAGHTGHGLPEPADSKVFSKDNSTAKLIIPDVDVLTQDGKRVKFYSDLIKGKKVMINFIYTSCGLICPRVGSNSEKLQKTIKDLKDDVFIITVTTDPAVDSPQILKKWSEQFYRQSGWTIVTGREKEMKQLLTALTGSGPQRGLHTSLLILFDGISENWDTSSSLVRPVLLLDKLNKLAKVTEK